MNLRVLSLPLLVSLTLAGPSVLAATDSTSSASARPTVSRELAPILKSAQTALLMKDFDQALVILKATDAMPKSEYEERVIAQLRHAANAQIRPRFTSPSDLKPQE